MYGKNNARVHASAGVLNISLEDGGSIDDPPSINPIKSFLLPLVDLEGGQEEFSKQ